MNKAIKSIKKVMYEEDINQHELAVKLGITDSHLSLILQGKRKLSKDIIRKLNTRYSISLETLLFPHVEENKEGQR